jgi:glycine/D-amino acid oxidase-like deaminating enzyme
VAQHGSSIFWHETLAPRTGTPPATGTLTCDVVIVGGGFTGLWTAHHLLRGDPGLDVVILEAHDVGFGASGRNGGFAMTLLDFSLHQLAAGWGDEAAAQAHRAVARSVRAIDRTVTEEGIDCDLEATGLLKVATNDAQVGRLEREAETAARLGLEGFRTLDRSRVQEQLRSPGYVAGLLDDECVIVNPARLTVGLADVVRRQSARILESSPVTGIAEHPAGVTVTTGAAEVRADTGVLATNAWTQTLPGFGGQALPLYTYVVLTEPLSDDQWASIGWEGRQGVEDVRNYVHYYRPTADGRVLWGGTDAVYYYGGPVSPRRDRHEGIRRRLEREFLATFPQLGPVRFTHHWGGPISVTSRFVPRVGSLDGGRLHYAFGYSGHGVAPAHTAAGVLADRILGREVEVPCFVDAPQPGFPPEPLAWIGGELTRRQLQRQDRRMDAGRDAGDADPLLLRALDRLS